VQTQRSIVLAATAAAFGLGSLTGCQSLSKKEQGAIIGAATGAAAGAAVGSKNGGVARGAIIGAAVGGAAGAIIGHQMDQHAKELEQNIPGAIVERVGEGIEVTFQSGLLFDYDEAALKPAARENLLNLARSLDKYPNTSLLIAGHTDATGTDSYNLELSQRRARAAADYLVSQGVDASRLRTVGMGESEPEASNESPAGQAQNRRVEVAIFADEALRAEAKRRAGN
jgi:outer membrane protein OmpA-like peptidoglycan-associated protein